MITQKKPSRANTVRQRRATKMPKERVSGRSKPAFNTQKTGTRQTSRTSAQRTSTSRQAYRPESVFLPVEPRPIAPTTLRQLKTSALRQTFGVDSKLKTKGIPGQRTLREPHGKMTKNPHRTNTRTAGKGYEVAFNLGRTAVRAPLLSLPNLGSRWVSAGVTLILGFLLYTMSTANTFKVAAVELRGNQRLDATDVNTSIDLTGQPIYKAVPSQIEKDLRAAFPDLASVNVRVVFPNHLKVAVVERTPILAWYQDGNTKWIDPDGVAFSPRGNVPGLVQISSNSNPPKPPEDSQKSLFDQPFIEPAMVQAILALSPQIPGGAPMIYDPKYGMGWQDPRGWSVYFGQNTQEIEMKKKIYEAILDTFSQQGIQPTLVSVAYLDAPFYK
jgi:hypothetical protein